MLGAASSSPSSPPLRGARACAGAAAGRRPTAARAAGRRARAAAPGRRRCPRGGRSRARTRRAHARGRQRAVVGARAGLDEQRNVDHHVADELDAAGDVLALEVRHRGRRGAEQQIGEVVGENAVELLGHRAVERPHAGLDVCDRHVGERRGQAARERRVRVAVDEDGVRTLGGEQRAERGEHARRLLACSCRRRCRARAPGAGHRARRRRSSRARRRSAGRCGRAARRARRAAGARPRPP